jgi:cytochrome c oxidase subunit 2
MGATSTTVVNEGLYYIAAFAFLLFFAIVFLMVLFAVRYRRSRNPVAAEIPGRTWVEILAFVLPTLLALSMFYYGLTGYSFLRKAPAGALEVEVRARQFAWLFIYPNGRRSPDLIVPVGRDVRLVLTSEDVLHGFYVPDYHIQIDCVPGMKTSAWFRATQTGEHDIMCSLYCGVGHSSMLAKLKALPAQDYEAWNAGAPAPAQAGAAAGGSMSMPMMAGGEDLLRQEGCLACHSLDGSSKTGPTFKGLAGSTVKVVTAGKPREVTADEEYLRRSILDPRADVVVGYPDVMPAPPGGTSDETIEGLVQAIEALR